MELAISSLLSSVLADSFQTRLLLVAAENLRVTHCQACGLGTGMFIVIR